MAMQNKRTMIDTRWWELRPNWAPKEHGGEREILYQALGDGESIEALVGCVWGPDNVFSADANQFDKMRQFDGIAVATGSRVVFLRKRGLSKIITEMPLHSIDSVDVDDAGEVTLTGRSYSEWSGSGNPKAFKMRDVQGGDARNFADRVREVQAAPPPSAHRPIRLAFSIDRGPHRAAFGEPVCRYEQGGADRCPVAGALHHVGTEQSRYVGASDSRSI